MSGDEHGAEDDSGRAAHGLDQGDARIPHQGKDIRILGGFQGFLQNGEAVPHPSAMVAVPDDGIDLGKQGFIGDNDPVS